MADRVLLHVGAPKSGTSYLQQILWANRQRLLDDGVLLPGTRRAPHQAMGDLRRGKWEDPTATWTWDRLAGEIDAHDGTAVVSEEMLGAATTEQAESAVRRLAPAEVHVVVAVRDLWRLIPSAWQQAVRARSVGSFTDFVAGLQDGRNPGFWDNQMPVPVLERWTTLVPPEARHVLVVPPPDAERDLLWRRFCQVLELDPDRYETGTPVGNPSLGALEAEILRRVNSALGDSYPLSRPYLGVVRRHLTLPVLMAHQAPARFSTPPEARAWVQRRSTEIVDELREFPCRVAGDLEDLLPRDFAEHRSPDAYTAGELLDGSVEAMVGMLAHVDKTVTSLERTVARRDKRIEALERELSGLRRGPWASVVSRVRRERAR